MDTHKYEDWVLVVFGGRLTVQKSSLHLDLTTTRPFCRVKRSQTFRRDKFLIPSMNTF